ncbi:MAG: cell division protein ZapD [Janthinobacterium lividum]
MILYEYPFNERIRTLLRLEDLFERFTFFLAQEDPRAHHTALTTLFEIADVTGRADLRADLLKELDRQKQTLASYRENPGIEQDQLEAVLGQIDHALAGLGRLQGKPGQHLSDNEWLGSIRSRMIIPGGTCKFDLPSYYAWQQNSAEQRRDDITKWIMPIVPLQEAASIVLRLARESGQAAKVMAPQGSYQQMLSGRSYQLMQVRVSATLKVIPEASANKYMLWVRFTSQDGDLKPRAVDSDVPFMLTLCNL